MNMDMIGNQAYHLDLRQQLCLSQKSCPGCGKPSCIGNDLHHLFVRRVKKNFPELYNVIGISLVCSTCHTGMGEAPRLNYSCTIQKFNMGITPDMIEKWIAALPVKAPLALPAFYYEAKEDWLTKD